MNEESINLGIIRSTKKLFVSKSCDFSNENIIASIASAASKMLLATDLEVSEEVVKNAVIDTYVKAFGKTKNIDVDVINQVCDMLNPNYVKANIGFSVDYNDYGAARAVYEIQKNEYDYLYSLTEDYQISKGR